VTVRKGERARSEIVLEKLHENFDRLHKRDLLDVRDGMHIETDELARGLTQIERDSNPFFTALLIRNAYTKFRGPKSDKDLFFTSLFKELKDIMPEKKFGLVRSLSLASVDSGEVSDELSSNTIYSGMLYTLGVEFEASGRKGNPIDFMRNTGSINLYITAHGEGHDLDVRLSQLACSFEESASMCMIRLSGPVEDNVISDPVVTSYDLEVVAEEGETESDEDVDVEVVAEEEHESLTDEDLFAIDEECVNENIGDISDIDLESIVNDDLFSVDKLLINGYGGWNGSELIDDLMDDMDFDPIIYNPLIK